MLNWNLKMILILNNCLKLEVNLVKCAIDFTLLTERKRCSQFMEIEFSRLLTEKDLTIFREIRKYSLWEKI